MSVLDVQTFRGAECNPDCCQMVAKVREKQAVGKHATQKFDAERFSFRKLNELEVRKQFQIKISNRFAALEGLRNFGGGLNPPPSTPLSDAAGMNHRRLQCFTPAVHTSRMVQCCQFGKTYC